MSEKKSVFDGVVINGVRHTQMPIAAIVEIQGLRNRARKLYDQAPTEAERDRVRQMFPELFEQNDA